ncbi:DUF4197 domain-containing protein [Glycocaulis abyssi]|uniref:DUF4197 domain-containing protein n=1 Tax=Glycocaulis abyssi TaxID=1433403 RepID=A0ABV9NF89_9PROT
MDRRTFLATGLAFTITPAGFAQGDSNAAIRQLLTTATQAATTRLGQRDGFFGDPVVRIPLPGTMRSVQQRLQPVGLAGPLDDVEMRMNRAAEQAMPPARRLVVDAIRSLTIQDATSIIRGPDTAATQYLRGRTETPLTGLLRPPMEETLTASGAYSALDSASGLLNQRSGLGGLFGGGGGSPAANLRGQLTDFAVTRALDGIFHYVGEEERSIRRDPVSRATGLLRGLFGG